MKYSNNISILISVLFFMVFTGCEKENFITERDYPRVDISETISQSASGVTFEGVFLTETDEPILDKGFLWASETAPFMHNAPSVSAGEGYGDGTFSATASTELVAGVEYNYRAYARTADLVIYSRFISFVCQYTCE